jgi:hypothetical protein
MGTRLILPVKMVNSLGAAIIIFNATYCVDWRKPTVGVYVFAKSFEIRNHCWEELGGTNQRWKLWGCGSRSRFMEVTQVAVGRGSGVWIAPGHEASQSLADQRVEPLHGQRLRYFTGYSAKMAKQSVYVSLCFHHVWYILFMFFPTLMLQAFLSCQVSWADRSICTVYSCLSLTPCRVSHLVRCWLTSPPPQSSDSIDVCVLFRQGSLGFPILITLNCSFRWQVWCLHAGAHSEWWACDHRTGIPSSWHCYLWSKAGKS